TLLSDRGLPSARTPRTLMVSPQMQKTAEEILGTPLRPYTDENTKNVVAGSVELMVNRYLTSNTAWYVLGGKGALGSDSHAMTVLHHWENRVVSWYDPATSGYSIKTSFRSAYGFTTWRGVVGSQGA
ncbi:MAG: hypothetical protein ACREQ5_16155, partial [Candidatus Dormibacteria bacterium]